MNNYIIELAAYNPPKAVETRQDAWVKYGEKNDYYKFLIERYNNSTTNNQVINNICKLIYGKGLDARDAFKKPNEYAQIKMLFSKETLRKAVTDYYLLGQFALQLIYSKNKKTIVEVHHIPMELLRPEKCNADGVIMNYYYSDNWDKLREFPPTAIPTFGNGNKTLEILVCGEYTIGQKYFSTVKYLGGLAYAKLEENISEYLISLVETNFSPLKIINFNNGVPDEDLQKKIVDSVKKQTTGASGDKFIVSFNSDETKKTTIDSVPLDNAAQQYEYLSNEARNKIMLSHGVTSGLLFGIPTANGFSSNADEMKNAFILFQNNVIKPAQEFICDQLDKILAYNGYSLDLYFKALNPLTDYDAPVAVAPVKMSAIDEINLDSFGEVIDTNEWELVSANPVDYDTESELDAELESLNNPSLFSKLWSFVSTGTANPNAKSGQDGVLFKSRYRYSGDLKDNSRDFCKKMINSNKVYRKEDIVKMSSQKVNEGWGPNGADTYDIFLYKGGGACHHFWTRETYRKKADVNSPLADKITPAQARKQGEILPTNDKLVYTKPIDMPNQGFLPK
jgi:hypothetical protein